MKKFELLRPLPDLEVGTIFTVTPVEEYGEEITDDCGEYHFSMDTANNKTWFRELTEHDDKQRHLELLVDAFWANLKFNDGSYYGRVGLNEKRPFGNSNVMDDICDIIGLVPHFEDGAYSSDQLNYAGKLYREDLIPYLKSKYALS